MSDDTLDPHKFTLDPGDFVAGLERGLKLIEAFDDAHPRMSIAQAAARTQLPRSATRRHLLTLCHLGYLQTDGKLYWPAPRALRLGRSYLSASRLPRQVQPAMQQLATTIGESVNVSVLDGHEVAYVARSASPRLVSIGFQPGDRAPAHVVAAGVMLVSALPKKTQQRWILDHEFTGFTPKTVTSREQFAATVIAAQGEGFCWLEQQLNTGLTGVAVLLSDMRGRCHGAMGTTFASTSWSRAEVAGRLVPALRAAAEGLRPLL